MTARARLQTAAIALFLKQGFDGTTAAEIATQAGVTERTFFRHFADKREVLFEGQAILLDALLEAIANTHGDQAPMALLFHAFRSVCPLLENNRPFSKPRQDIINATPALQERELAKIATLAEALEAREIPAFRAALAARMGMAIFTYVTNTWLGDDSRPLRDRVDEAERTASVLLGS